MKSRRRVCYILFAVMVLFLLMRIVYVNQHARLPQINIIGQGDKVTYCGLEYEIVNASIWDYSRFFEKNEYLKEYKDTENDSTMWKILLVEYQITKTNQKNKLDLYIPIRYAHTFNGVDAFMVQEMNSTLLDGTFESGDIVRIPYEIYRENLTDEQWKDVEQLDMTYRAILGTYPVRNEMMITNVVTEECE